MLELTITRADPAGNTTLLIAGNVPASRYASLGAELICSGEFAAEQAGFIVPPKNGGAGRLEMSGGEFCGNAARAFACYLVHNGLAESGELLVEISGASQPVRAQVDLKRGEAWAEMPLPESLEEIRLPEPFGNCPIVKFEGIWHVIACGIPATREAFLSARDHVYAKNSPEAFGVMFLAEDMKHMTPVVYVDASGTLFFESSCGSGTTAVAAWLAEMRETEAVTLIQPGGILRAEVKRENGRTVSIRMGGSVSLEKTCRISIKE